MWGGRSRSRSIGGWDGYITIYTSVVVVVVVVVVGSSRIAILVILYENRSSGGADDAVLVVMLSMKAEGNCNRRFRPNSNVIR